MFEAQGAATAFRESQGVSIFMKRTIVTIAALASCLALNAAAQTATDSAAARGERPVFFGDVAGVRHFFCLFELGPRSSALSLTKKARDRPPTEERPHPTLT